MTRKQKQQQYKVKYGGIPVDYTQRLNWMVDKYNLSPSKMDEILCKRQAMLNNMFYYDVQLANLNVSSFDTSNVTDMELMFGSCDALTSLDLSNFDTNGVQNYSYMFLNDNNTQVYIGDNWNSAMTESATNYSKTFIKK